MRYTTVLLTTRRLHPRDRAVLAIVVGCLVLFAAGLAAGTRPAAAPQLAPRLTTYVFIIATPSPRPEPTLQPTPEPVVVFQTVEVPIVIEHYSEVLAAPEAPVAAQDGSGATIAPTAEGQHTDALPEPGQPGFVESFQEPAGPNPFIGCVTPACRAQQGR